MKTTTTRKLLLASAAVAVLGLGALSTPAQAFDDVNWEWNKTVTEDVLKTVTVDINTSPSGMVELEKIQTQIGDVTASSNVTNITNNPPGEDGAQAAPAPELGPQTITIDLKGYYDEPEASDSKDIFALDLKDGTTEGVELGDWEGQVDENNDRFRTTFDLTVPPAEMEPAPAPGPNQIPIGERLGVDLPQVASAATAVGNNQDISSSTSLELHDAQYLFGGFGEPDTAEGPLGDVFNTEDVGNTHTNALSDLLLAASQGLITPATVSADSTVTTILNATVDSSATAVGNNMSLELAAFTPDDAFVIADATQFSYADVTATSLVDDVTLEGYSDLGAAGLGPVPLEADGAQTPIVNSVATAVGNNFSLKVSSPEL